MTLSSWLLTDAFHTSSPDCITTPRTTTTIAEVQVTPLTMTIGHNQDTAPPGPDQVCSHSAKIFSVEVWFGVNSKSLKANDVIM